ncbi:MAG TPA: ROK family protein, partial [Steroidobacteraceae bacterium]
MTTEVLGIDVGGSSVKAGLVDVQRGTVQGALISAPTPRPCTPGSLMPVLVALAARLHDGTGPVGVAFPSVIKGGTAYTAANIDASWIGTNGAALAAEALGRPVLMLNDADAAGIAEMRFGSGRGCTGTVVMLTFGTGIGTALFTGGKLFANTELGHLELRGMDAEKWASAQTRTVAG